MKVTAEQFDKAFLEFQQFGLRRRIPIEERWREVLTEVSSSDFSELKTECEAIEAFAYSLAEQVRDKKISDRVARGLLAQKFSFLTKERLGHTWSQAMYYSLK